MKISDKVYDILKWLIIIVIPAASTAIIGYGELYGWQSASVIAKSITIAQTFLGTIFAVTYVKYQAQKSNGKVSIVPEDDQNNE